MVNLPAAITKDQAKSDLSDKVQSWMVSVIPIINGKLQNFAEGDHRNIYDNDVKLASLPTEARSRAIELIIGYYQAAKWTVQYHSGVQKDPEGFFHFS